MRKFLVIATAGFLSLFSFAGAQRKTPTAEIVSAANNFLATLSAEQRQKVLYPQRHHVPHTQVTRHEPE
jgi:hypothetical protein